MDWTPLLNGLGKGDCKTRRETFQVRDLVRLILDIWRKFALVVYTQMMKIEAFWMVRNTRNFANCAAMAYFASFYIQIMIFIIGNRTVRNQIKQWWHNSWTHVCVVCPEWVIFLVLPFSLSLLLDDNGFKGYRLWILIILPMTIIRKNRWQPGWYILLLYWRHFAAPIVCHSHWLLGFFLEIDMMWHTHQIISHSIGMINVNWFFLSLEMPSVPFTHWPLGDVITLNV